MSKVVLFQTIRFSISTQFSSNWPIGPYLGTTTPGLRWSENDGNKGVCCIPQSSNAGDSLSDCLTSYKDRRLGGGRTPLQRSNRRIQQPQFTGPLIGLMYSTQILIVILPNNHFYIVILFHVSNIQEVLPLSIKVDLAASSKVLFPCLYISRIKLVYFRLFCIYDIPNIVGYLMPNPIYTYI